MNVLAMIRMPNIMLNLIWVHKYLRIGFKSISTTKLKMEYKLFNPESIYLF